VRILGNYFNFLYSTGTISKKTAVLNSYHHDIVTSLTELCVLIFNLVCLTVLIFVNREVLTEGNVMFNSGNWFSGILEAYIHIDMLQLHLTRSGGKLFVSLNDIRKRDKP
jgi:hypothetical protein